MKIAIFDYKVTRNNPIGGCHLRMLTELSGEHEFTIFAVKFENPYPEKIRFVRIPAPERPLVLLFIVYHLLAPIIYFIHKSRHRVRFDYIQTVESKLSFGDLVHTQFCHRAYLKYHWKESKLKGVRGILRWLDHKLHALVEPFIYRQAKYVVVPSRGLERELESEFPCLKGKTRIIPNPVDINRMKSPDQFDREKMRDRIGISDKSIALVFVALGQFERKGVHFILEALRRIDNKNLTLVIVGGEKNLVKTYKSLVKDLGIQEKIIFAGMQTDIRPFLWAADLFVFPSLYETFSLVTFEAAAAGLPLCVTRLHGVEDLIADGVNGMLVERGGASVADSINRFIELSVDERREMGKRAQSDVAQYNTNNFAIRWRNLFGALNQCRHEL